MNEYGTYPETGTVRFERVLPGPIEKVWAYLTESDKRKKWLASGPMDLRVGGKVELTWHNEQLHARYEPAPEKYRSAEGYKMVSRITACEPPRLLSFTWIEDLGEESEVRFELVPQGGKVLLVLTHRRLSQKTQVETSAGWHTHLNILADQLYGREPQPFWPAHLRLEQEYQGIIGSATLSGRQS